MTSLRARLSFGLVASLVVLLALQWSIAGIVIEQLVERQLVNRLSQDAENLLAGIDFDQEGKLALNPARVNAVYRRPFSGHYFVIKAGKQVETSRSLWDGRLSIPTVKPGERELLRMQGPEQQPLLLLAHGYQKQGQAVLIAVAGDLSEIHAGLRQFKFIHGVISLAILIVLLGIQYFIVTHALKPLHKVREDLQRLERGELERIGTHGPQEILPLIAEFNRLLVAMGRKTRRSRETSGNLAHALKTQLALLQQAVGRPEVRQHPELQAQLQQIGDNMHRSVERELKRARLMGAALPGQRINLAQEIAVLVQTLQLMYAGKSPQIDWQVAEDVCFEGDREDTLELLGNLLDNACKWCKKRVRLRANANDGVSFVIEDDGPGCTSGKLEEITRRGFRLDESRPGSGLGLAIVLDIIESYGGSIAFAASRSLGGLKVDIYLPNSTAPRING